MIDFESLQREVLEKDAKVYPQYVARASSLGDECMRRLYYGIANWQDRIPPSATLKSIFEVGNVQEEHLALPRLRKMRGIKIVEGQSQYSLENPKITMSIDGKVLIEEQNEFIDEPVGSKFPIEIKTVGPYDFVKLNSIEDFTRSKRWYQRAYVAQINLYLLGTNSPFGYMVLVNKITGILKFIRVTLDFDYCDMLVKKAQALYEALAKKEPPERIDDFELCQHCDFRAICLPEISFAPVKIMDKEDLIDKLNERAQLKASVDRFNEIDDEIKTSMKAEGTGDFIVGNFAIKVKEKTRKAYTVPESTYSEVRIAGLK